MVSPRFALALEQLGPEQWGEFERLAAEFLAVEYPSLRTMASKSGDKGRDGELFFPEEDSRIAFQYSVTVDWKVKISNTQKRLADTKPSVDSLIYVTNQTIGPDADEIKRKLRAAGVSLDVRDKSWFTERELTHAQREVAAAELAARYVDPLLHARGVTEHLATVLNESESRVALLHLVLDSEDKASEKGLTKTSFESLVLCALEGTSTTSTRPKSAVLERVRELLPSGDAQQVEALATSALERLKGKGGPVHFHQSTSGYCLSYERILRTQEKIAQYVANERALEDELSTLVEPLLTDRTGAADRAQDVARQLRLGIEHLLLTKGEAFAAAVGTGQMPQIDVTEAVRILESRLPKGFGLTIEQAVAVIFDVVQRPSHTTQGHLRRLSDAYTLFAFLRQTPDVQKAIVKIFKGGQLWLDASVVLPMLGETLIDDSAERHFTVLLKAARDAGLQLFVTDGIIEELERHINRSVTFARTTERWRGRVPFLYSAYATSGRARSDFPSWAAEFRGEARPEEDVEAVLAEAFGIRRRNLAEYSDPAAIELRAAVQEVWQEAHDRRRDDDVDTMTRARLVAHDVENCVGVIQLRRGAASITGGLPLLVSHPRSHRVQTGG